MASTTGVVRAGAGTPDVVDVAELLLLGEDCAKHGPRLAKRITASMISQGQAPGGMAIFAFVWLKGRPATVASVEREPSALYVESTVPSAIQRW
ncbi:hypothetical protein CBOM_00841 [Ceraceosorus bombacis]|uniref:Uncharacterized protein n=1 Tax=Ceraceosorus bombacis TaxID=401625 RepID=A0A0P1BAM6_9BASI|nr:hypothetical protein CBOM_00841 [Ceraceosorus bombacis]